MNSFLDNIFEYLKHDSTWKGIFSILTAAGLAFKPEQAAAIMTAGMSLVGLIQIFITDRNIEK